MQSWREPLFTALGLCTELVPICVWFYCSDLTYHSYHAQKNSHVGIHDELVRGPSHLGHDVSGAVSRRPLHPTTHRRQGGDRLHVHDPPRRRFASRSSRLGRFRWAHLALPAHIVLTNGRVLSPALHLLSTHSRPNPTRILSNRAPSFS